MSTAKGIMLCGALLLSTAARAPAHTDRPNPTGRTLSSSIYRTLGRCSPSDRIDFSRLQPGELAIMEQDQGYREGIGLPRDAGECW